MGAGLMARQLLLVTASAAASAPIVSVVRPSGGAPSRDYPKVRPRRASQAWLVSKFGCQIELCSHRESQKVWRARVSTACEMSTLTVVTRPARPDDAVQLDGFVDGCVPDAPPTPRLGPPSRDFFTSDDFHHVKTRADDRHPSPHVQIASGQGLRQVQPRSAH